MIKDRIEDAPLYLQLLEAERGNWWQSANFDKWKGHYISEYPRGHFVLGLLRSYVPDFDPLGARVLDVGCGDGGVVIAFAEAGSLASGIEPNERSLRRAQVRAEEHGVSVDFRTGYAETLPYPGDTFDLVILDNVLEHVEDREKTVREIRRVLRPGGLFYVVTPKPFAFASLWSDPHYQMAGLVLLPRRWQVWYFEVVRGGGRGNYGVGRIPTRSGVRRLLERNGFTPLVSPREIWIRYLRSRISRPGEVRGAWKGRLAGWLSRRDWIFERRLPRWLLDVSVGTNYFIARRDS
jgi:2-polyprenyl-3-methyl-5-hydroxy-6-metoxy-1,4-benzoquinol methylase